MPSPQAPRSLRPARAVAAWLLTLSTQALSGTVPVHPQLDCIAGDRSRYVAQFGYWNAAFDAQTRPITPENNIFIGGPVNPFIGQPTLFLPGQHRDVFRAEFDALEAPAYFWVLDGTLLRVSPDAPSCVWEGTPRLHAFAECASIDPRTGQGQARFGYFNAGVQPVGYASPHTHNRFGSVPITSAASARGQPSVFMPGFHSPAFTVQFDPRFEDGVAWQIEQNFVVAVPGLAGLPACDAMPSMRIEGSGQQALPGTDFAQSLRLQLLDAAGQPLSAQPIEWWGRALSAGPDAAFLAYDATTDAEGRAQAQVRANAMLGAYQVIVIARDLRLSAAFHLEHVAELALPVRIFGDSFE